MNACIVIRQMVTASPSGIHTPLLQTPLVVEAPWCSVTELLWCFLVTVVTMVFRDSRFTVVFCESTVTMVFRDSRFTVVFCDSTVTVVFCDSSYHGVL